MIELGERKRTLPKRDEPAIEQVERIRAIADALPETHEEYAWVGVRWRIRTKTFAHVLTVTADGPGAYARALGDHVLGDEALVTVLSFRSALPELDALRAAGPPFFHGGWGRDQMLVVLDADTDWTEIAELVTESYRLLAPKRLAATVQQPPTVD